MPSDNPGRPEDAGRERNESKDESLRKVADSGNGPEVSAESTDSTNRSLSEAAVSSQVHHAPYYVNRRPEPDSIVQLITAAKEVEEASKAGGRPDQRSVNKLAEALVSAIEEGKESLDPQQLTVFKAAVKELASIGDLSKLDRPGSIAFWGKVIEGGVLIIDVMATGGALTLHKITFGEAAVLLAVGGVGATGIDKATEGLDLFWIGHENQKRLSELNQLLEVAELILRVTEEAQRQVWFSVTDSGDPRPLQ